MLLDIRQNEELKIKGFAREIINKVQKLKKKSKLLPENPFLIFYRFGESGKYLNLAMEREADAISNAIKKPFVPFNFT